MGRGVTISLLGGFRVEAGDRTISEGDWRHRRGADLVKLLALSPNRRLHREQVMDALWPELEPEAAAGNLRKATHFARRAIGSEEAVATREGMLTLFPGAEPVVDASRFEDAAQRALDARDPAAARDAAALYTGELLPADRFAEWTLEPRVRLRDLHTAALRTAGMWERLVEEDRADEQAHRELMRRYLDAGNRRAAMQQFERLREALRVDLGVSPDAESAALYEKVLALEGHEPPTPSERARALLAWGLVHFNRRDLREAEKSAREARTLAIESGLTQEVGEASALLGLVAHAQGRWRDAFREEFVDVVNNAPTLTTFVIDAHICFAEFALYGREGHSQLAGFAQELLAIADEARSVHGRALAKLLLGEIELLSGRLDRAELELGEAESLHGTAGALSGQTLAVERLAETAIARGRRWHAGRLLARARKMAEAAPMSPHLLVRVLGAMVHAAPDPARGVRIARESTAALSGREVCQPCSMGFRIAATLACAGGRETALAHEHLAEAERVAAMWQSGPWVAAVWEARGAVRLAEGEGAQAAALFKEAAEVFAGVTRPIDEARCRAAAAAAAG